MHNGVHLRGLEWEKWKTKISRTAFGIRYEGPYSKIPSHTTYVQKLSVMISTQLASSVPYLQRGRVRVDT